MTSTKKESIAETQRQERIARLREFVAALERRVPHLEREGEQRIAADAALLKKKAQARIAELEAGAPS